MENRAFLLVMLRLRLSQAGLALLGAESGTDVVHCIADATSGTPAARKLRDSRCNSQHQFPPREVVRVANEHGVRTVTEILSDWNIDMRWDPRPVGHGVCIGELFHFCSLNRFT